MLKLIIVFWLSLVFQFVNCSSKISSFSKSGNICYRQGQEFNTETLNEFEKYQQFYSLKEVDQFGLASSKKEEIKQNKEYANDSCNLINQLSNYQSELVKNQNVFFYNFLNDFHSHDFEQQQQYYLEKFERREVFEGFKTSKLFRPHDQNAVSLQNQQNQQDYNLAVFVFVISSEPYVVLKSNLQYIFYDGEEVEQMEIKKDRGLPFINRLKKTVHDYAYDSYESFRSFISKSRGDQQLKQLEEEIEKVVTYYMLALQNPHQQNTKYFAHYQITVKFDSLEGLHPYIHGAQLLDIYSSKAYSKEDQEEQNAKYQTLQKLIPQSIDIMMEVIDKFEGNFNELSTQMKKYDAQNASLQKNGFQLLINQANEYVGVLQNLQKKPMSEYFPYIYWLCGKISFPKHFPILKYVQDKNYLNWEVKIAITHYNFNSQRCNILLKYSNIKRVPKEFKHRFINRIPEYYDLHNKGRFLQLLKNFDKQGVFNFTSRDFFPEAYLLKYKQNYMSKDEKDFMKLDFKKDTNQWINKPVSLSQGRGISIFESLKDAQDHFKVYKFKNSTSQQYENETIRDYIIQKYVKDTQTIENRKFDIRCYLIFVWIEEGYELVVYNSGKVRRSISEYEKDGEVNDLKQHLTNISFTKDKYVKELDIYQNQTSSNMQQFKDYLIDKEGMSEEQFDQIQFEIKKLLTYTAEAFLNKISRNPGHYELYGMDVMFDKDWKPFLLEANTQPQFNLEEYSPLLVEQAYEVLGSLYDIIIQFMENQDRIREIIKNNEFKLGHLELLINNATGFNLLNDYRTTNSNNSDQKIEL